MQEKRRRFTPEQKRQVVQSLIQYRGAGHSWKTVSEQMGICEGVLRNWYKQMQEQSVGCFRPVQLTRMGSQPSARLSIQGYRIDGLTAEDVVGIVMAMQR